MFNRWSSSRVLFVPIVWLAFGCGGPDQTSLDGVELGEPSLESPAKVLGSLELALQLGDALDVPNIDWKIDGPTATAGSANLNAGVAATSAFSASGQIGVGKRPVASARIGGIPAGQGYTIQLSYGDATMQCGGSATFNVTAGATTAVRVDVQCLLTATNGQLELSATLNVCPVVSALSAAPIELEVGDTAQLWAEVQDLDHGPRSPTVRWVTDGGTLTSDGLTASLTCLTVSKMTVWAYVTDGTCETKAGLVIRCVDVQLSPIDWPGSPDFHTVDPTGTFDQNISGAAYQSASGDTPETLWVVQNGPSRIIPLFSQGDAADTWAPPSTGSWTDGKYLTYPDGTGEPDSEDLTFAGTTDAVYVSTERNNNPSGASRLSVLRYELGGDATTLIASREWNLTAQLPPVGANLGLEAITWIPDDFLVAHGFFDEHTNGPYDPSLYAAHAGGLFLVGVEADGKIHAFTLDHESGEATQIASFTSGQSGIMAIDFDRDTGQLWAQCDDGCQGEMTVLRIDEDAASATRGHFQVFAALRRPANMPNINNEGMTFVPESQCVDGLKRIFWTDDSNDGGHSVRAGLMPCGPLK